MDGKLKWLLAGVVLAMLFSGCLTSAPPPPKSWVVSASRKSSSELSVDRVARLGSISVASPYDRPALSVMRRDGSVAFDPYNQFALAPSSLLKGAALDVIAASGVFKAVLPSSTAARTDTTLEISVDRFALDCRREGVCDAAVALTVWLVKDRMPVKTVKGEALKSARDGGYAAAFSAAFADALASAVDRL